ncbi:MAG: hypothetical protein JWN15_2348 [Firmicutes bacterium]|nr:hypothetical protein [Bacillota bacterium]
MEAGGARVLHFKLKADVDAKVGTQLPVVVAGISDDNTQTAAVNSLISIGTAASASTPAYSDVPASHWAYGYISRATASGYMAGSAGRFNPDSPLSRGELVVLLLKLRGVEAIPFVASPRGVMAVTGAFVPRRG